MCDKKDYVDREGCTDQFNESPASDSCYLSTDHAELYTTNPDGESPEDFLTAVGFSKHNLTCSFWAKCDYLTPEWTIGEKETSIENVHFLDADDLYNCSGNLKKESESC